MGEGFLTGGALRSAGRHGEAVAAGAVRVHVEADESAVLFGGGQQDGAGPIAEKDGVAAVPVDDVGKGVCADDHDVAVQTRGDELAAGGQREEGAGTDGGDVESGGVGRTEFLLDHARRGGGRSVWGGRGEHDEVEFRGGHAGHVEGPLSGLRGQFTGGLALADAALLDAEPLLNPGIVRSDAVEVLVGDNVLWSVRAGSGNDGVGHGAKGKRQYYAPLFSNG